MYTIEDFMAVIKELIQFLENVTTIEKRKLESAAKNDIFGVEKCITSEQAESLKLRGIELKREKIQAALSLDGLSFREIISKTDDEHRAEITALYSRLQNTLDLYKSTSSSAVKIIENNLYKINKQLEEIKRDKEKAGQSVTYSSNGQFSPGSAGFTNKKA